MPEKAGRLPDARIRRIHGLLSSGIANSGRQQRLKK